MLITALIVIFIFRKSGDESLIYFTNAVGIALIWVSIFIVQMPFRLKRIEVNEKGLKIKTGNRNGIIPFKNISAVSKFDFVNPWMITIKYLDPNTGKVRKISFMPDAKYQRFMKEDAMTEYLTQQSRLENPDFAESSTVKNIAILFLAGLPFFMGMIYYASKAGAFGF